MCNLQFVFVVWYYDNSELVYLCVLKFYIILSLLILCCHPGLALQILYQPIATKSSVVASVTNNEPQLIIIHKIIFVFGFVHLQIFTYFLMVEIVRSFHNSKNIKTGATSLLLSDFPQPSGFVLLTNALFKRTNPVKSQKNIMLPFRSPLLRLIPAPQTM